MTPRRGAARNPAARRHPRSHGVAARSGARSGEKMSRELSVLHRRKMTGGNERPAVRAGGMAANAAARSNVVRQ